MRGGKRGGATDPAHQRTPHLTRHLSSHYLAADRVEFRSIELNKSSTQTSFRRLRSNVDLYAHLTRIFWTSSLLGEPAKARMWWPRYLHASAMVSAMLLTGPLIAFGAIHGIIPMMRFSNIFLLACFSPIISACVVRLQGVVHTERGILKRVCAAVYLNDGDKKFLGHARMAITFLGFNFWLTWAVLTYTYQRLSLRAIQFNPTLPSLLLRLGMTSQVKIFVVSQVQVFTLSLCFWHGFFNYMYCLVVGAVVAKAACRHATEVVRTADPELDADWERSLTPPLIALHQDVLDPLSREFGVLLSLMCATLITLVLFFVPTIVLTPAEDRGSLFTVPLLCAIMAVSITLVPAMVTTDARHVMLEINNLRVLKPSSMRQGFVSLHALERIAAIEGYLERVNARKGLGFATRLPFNEELTIVFSTNTLIHVVVQLIVGFSVIFPVIARIYDRSVPGVL